MNEGQFDKVLFGIDMHCMHLFVGKEKNELLARTFETTEDVRIMLRKVKAEEMTIGEVREEIDRKIESLSTTGDRLAFSAKRTYEQLRKAIEGV